jgi:DNA-binding response OmpR family regulator
MNTVLVLDDDRIFRHLIVNILEMRGHRVLQAGRSAEADRLLDAENPDLLLVDGLLPDATGIQWIEKLRCQGRGTPVLFVTSFWKTLRDFETVTKTLGVTQLLRKPALPEAIADRVDSMLGVLMVPEQR